MTFERIAQLERGRVPFAVATVVARRSPVSSHLGDRAIVLSDGTMEGFVGGSCSRDLVRRYALEALRTGASRLLRIRPGTEETASDRGETIVVPMGCASEGAVDVYIEPHLPPRMLMVAGCTPVAHALRTSAAALQTYRVVGVVADEEVRDMPADERVETIALSALPAFLNGLPHGERSRVAAVVASQGHYDEAALGVLLSGETPGFVGLVASRKRAESVFAVLLQEGVPAARIGAVRNPVGLDIGARTPQDVAISVLAELVSERVSAPAEPPHERAVDPVCGMEVDVANASHRAEYEGAVYYFCCAHCRASFAADPHAYASAVPST